MKRVRPWVLITSCRPSSNVPPRLRRFSQRMADAIFRSYVIVGVQIADGKDNLKLFRPGKYPVIRGSALLTGDDQAFLWTAAYVPRLDTYIGPETPNPVLVRRQRGKCSFEIILRDVMGLTKINFNSCLHNDRLPVTIRFAENAPPSRDFGPERRSILVCELS